MTNDKLRIRITRPHPQAIVGEVISMPEEWRGISHYLIEHDDFRISSTSHPDAGMAVLWVWGETTTKDRQPFSYTFNTTADCDAWISKVRAAVRALNATIKPQPDGWEVVE